MSKASALIRNLRVSSDGDTRTITFQDDEETPRNRTNLPQSQLTEDTFSECVSGWQEVNDYNELKSMLGWKVRYLLDCRERGRASRKYRYGGILTKVDPEMRYIMLMNPVLNRRRGRNDTKSSFRSSWSVQLQDEFNRPTFYVMPPQAKVSGSIQKQIHTLLEHLGQMGDL
jgi:hypothetical protein